jgi:hypothetical protein
MKKRTMMMTNVDLHLFLVVVARNPVLMAATDAFDPHELQILKRIRFSFFSSVSGLLHVRHVTYSAEEVGESIQNFK